ncbi:MAG: LysM peptidoglycan-binding domain-containing protein [Gammaproteobacteria bacterium]|nr:LysM peptidoglycan-binding domain-containing protein [Gammaproteobacteria bacterium]
MNIAVIFIKYAIVTFLVASGVSACSFPSKRTPDPSQAESPSTTDADSPQAMGKQTETSAVDDNEQKQAGIQLRDNRPLQYTVKKGDTLWDISSQFLRDPWFWPEIWHKNQQVENPHLIYPGDVLTLIYVDGRPQVVVKTEPKKSTTSTSERGMKVVKLNPSIRKQGLDASVVTIPGDAIRQFLSKPRVVTKEELDSAPYILGSADNHLVMAQDNTVYVRGELDKERIRFAVFRPGEALTDFESEEILGYEAIYAGEAYIKQYGDPATARITASEREILNGDRLLPLDKSIGDTLYYPRTPDHKIEGRIISLFDALFGIAKFQIAVINRGNRDGLEVGHLLETLSTGETITDRFDPKGKTEVKLPDQRSGLMMVFQVFDKVSYGLILESTLVINNNDTVATP